MRNILEINWIRHFLIIVGIISLSQLGAFMLRNKASKTAEIILKPRYLNSKLVQEGLKTLSTLEPNSLNKLINLSRIIENKIEEKRLSFFELYKYHFAASTMLLILSSISVVIIFIVAQIGLNNAQPFLKTFFYVIATLTSFYALSPVVYKQESNITKNLVCYLKYENLQEEIYNYALTNHGNIPTIDTLDFNKFHSRVLDDMAKINSIDFEFNYKAIPNPDFGLKK
jgi:hypothetical protein